MMEEKVQRGRSEDATPLALEMEEGATAKDCRRLLGIGRGKGADGSLRASGRNAAGPHLDFRLLTSSTVRE